MPEMVVSVYHLSGTLHLVENKTRKEYDQNIFFLSSNKSEIAEQPTVSCLRFSILRDDNVKISWSD